MKKRTSDTGIMRDAAQRLRVGPPAALITLIALTAITWAAIHAATLRVVIIGDSTAYTYTAADSLRGWGQELGFFFNTGAVTVINKSIGGRSSRSFIEDGHWTSTKAILQKGDILLISFGTNDRGTVAERHADTAQFRLFLTQYVTEARNLGVIPVLISTVNQNSWNGTTFTEGFNIGANDYHGAMLRVVNALNVPFIDLEQKSAALFKSLGQSYLTNFIFIAGNTHFQEMGAVNIAKLIAQGIKELATDPDVGKLSAVLAPQYMVNVTSNKSDAGMITASGTYPQNAPITLDVIPKSGQTFQQWSDASGKKLTTDKHYSFAMGSSECSFKALYLGGTQIIEKRQIAATSIKPAVRIIANQLTTARTVSIISDEKMKSVRISNPAGRTLETIKPNNLYTTIDMHGVNAGMYFVSIATLNGYYVQTINIWK